MSTMIHLCTFLINNLIPDLNLIFHKFVFSMSYIYSFFSYFILNKNPFFI